MVIHESYVTRKPLEFTLIILVIVFIILIPIYFLTKQKAESAPESVLIAETYDEVHYRFTPESELSESDKKHLFSIDYEGNFVQWSGTLLACDSLNGLYRVSVDHISDGYGDVLFTTTQDCSNIGVGSSVTYRIKLIDWKVTTFIGSEGEISE
ncbi:hypothetical protein KY349_04895 [Candidatus Woesearchaeota archaeon]|nr:hypothetical protein [Candidatus Woesearchaeota archaeon]